MKVSDFSTYCVECNGELIFDPVRGEQICSNCGFVQETRIFDLGPEWRAYDSAEEQSRSRSGGPISFMKPNLGLKTEISSKNRDGIGNSLTSDKRRLFYRLSKLHNQEVDPKQRNLKTAMYEIRRICSCLGLKNTVAELSARYYRLLLEKDFIKGRSILGTVVGVIYLAARTLGVPLTLKDLEAVVDMDFKEIARCVRVILTEIGPTKARSNSNLIPLVFRIGENLKLTEKTIQEAVNVVRKARAKGITIGKNPVSIAAAAVYFASVKTGERRTQTQVAKAAKTTPVTIRNRFKEFLKVLGEQEIRNKIKRGAGATAVYVAASENQEL